MASKTDIAIESPFEHSCVFFFIANGALVLFERKAKQPQEMNQE